MILVRMFVTSARKHNWMAIAAKRAGIESLAEFAIESRDACMLSARCLKATDLTRGGNAP